MGADGGTGRGHRDVPQQAMHDPWPPRNDPSPAAWRLSPTKVRRKLAEPSAGLPYWAFAASLLTPASSSSLSHVACRPPAVICRRRRPPSTSPPVRHLPCSPVVQLSQMDGWMDGWMLGAASSARACSPRLRPGPALSCPACLPACLLVQSIRLLLWRARMPPEVERSSVSLKPPPAVPLRACHHAGSSPPTEIAHQQSQSSAVIALQPLGLSRGRADPADLNGLANEQQETSPVRFASPVGQGGPRRSTAESGRFYGMRWTQAAQRVERLASACQHRGQRTPRRQAKRATFFSRQGWPRQRDRCGDRSHPCGRGLLQSDRRRVRARGGWSFGASTGRCLPGSRPRPTRSTYESQQATLWRCL